MHHMSKRGAIEDALAPFRKTGAPFGAYTTIANQLDVSRAYVQAVAAQTGIQSIRPDDIGGYTHCNSCGFRWPMKPNTTQTTCPDCNATLRYAVLACAHCGQANRRSRKIHEWRKKNMKYTRVFCSQQCSGAFKKGKTR
jgi:hypothetical protein